jgi:hypothetical protein
MEKRPEHVEKLLIFHARVKNATTSKSPDFLPRRAALLDIDNVQESGRVVPQRKSDTPKHTRI